MKFANGFAHQKGAIFGFGHQKDDDTKTVLKISNLDQDSLNKLNKVHIHNLAEENKKLSVFAFLKEQEIPRICNSWFIIPTALSSP